VMPGPIPSPGMSVAVVAIVHFSVKRDAYSKRV
jgi:hypothetical protein